MVANPVSEFVLIMIFLQSRIDGPVRNHLFRIELKSLEEAITTAVQEEFSVRQAHASLTPYRPSKRVEAGGPEPMNLCSIESERPRSSSSKRLQKCNRFQKLGHYAYECSASRPVSRKLSEVIDRLPRRATDSGPTLLRSGPSKMVGISNGGAPY